MLVYFKGGKLFRGNVSQHSRCRQGYERHYIPHRVFRSAGNQARHNVNNSPYQIEFTAEMFFACTMLSVQTQLGSESAPFNGYYYNKYWEKCF